MYKDTIYTNCHYYNLQLHQNTVPFHLLQFATSQPDRKSDFHGQGTTTTPQKLQNQETAQDPILRKSRQT